MGVNRTLQKRYISRELISKLSLSFFADSPLRDSRAWNAFDHGQTGRLIWWNDAEHFKLVAVPRLSVDRFVDRT